MRLWGKHAKLRAPRPSKQRPQWGQLFTRVTVGGALLVLMLVAGALVVNFVRLTWTEHQINQQIARQEARNAAQRGLNLEYQGRADYMESDMAIEQAARERLGMAYEGETVMRPNIVQQPTPTIPPPTAPPGLAAIVPISDLPSSVTAANAVRWWRALFPGAGARP